jgi:hypothetical protein
VVDPWWPADHRTHVGYPTLSPIRRRRISSPPCRCWTTAYGPDTSSAGLVGFISAFVPGRRGVTEPDVQAWAADVTGQGRNYFLSLDRYLFLATNRSSEPVERARSWWAGGVTVYRSP